MIWHDNPTKHFCVQDHFWIMQTSCHDASKVVYPEPWNTPIRCNGNEVGSDCVWENLPLRSALDPGLLAFGMGRICHD